MKVLATPMPVSSAKRHSWREARLRMAPLPASTIGLRAATIAATACATALWSAPARRVLCATRGAPSTSAAARSSGTACWTDCAHFVIGRNKDTTSMCWWLSLCMRLVPAWPVITTIGARSMLASATPVTRLVAPGPSVPRHTPAVPVSRP
jgi:hypothetical protein